MSVVVKMKEEERLAEQFETVMANVSPMVTEGRGKNMRTITAFAEVPLSICFVDPRYQGMRAHKQLNKLENRFDKRKLAPITLVPHFEEHRFAIVDGQGRYKVAPKKGMDRLTATILMDAPEDPQERLKFEAEYFIGQDSEVEQVKPLEKHLARVIIGDENALIIERLIRKYDIKIVATPGRRKESVLGSYTETYSIAKNRGEKCLDFIFSIIKNAGWNHESNGYSTFVMRALREIWVNHQNERKEIHTYLSDTFRQMSPTNFSAEAKAKYPKREYKMACVLYAEDLVCDCLDIERKIICEDEKLNK